MAITYKYAIWNKFANKTQPTMKIEYRNAKSGVCCQYDYFKIISKI